MRVAKLTILIIVLYLLIGHVREGTHFSLPTILPFCSGDRPDFWFDGGGIAMIIIAIIGLRRLARSGDRDSSDSSDDFYYEEDDYETGQEDNYE